MLRILPLVAFSLSVGIAQAQITKAPASPRTKLTQEFGLIEATVDYGRPSVKEREIFGGLVPFGQVWRTGANASTKVSFSGNVKVGGEDVPAGDYALYSIPEADKWTVIIYKDTSHWGSNGYDAKNDLVRVEVPAQRLKDMQESMHIGFDNFHADGAHLVISWANTMVSVPIVTDSEAQILADIDKKVRNATGEVSAASYFDAGVYLYNKGREKTLASQWVDKAVEMQPEAFWRIYTQAEIASEMGDIEKAKASAMKTIKMAEASKRGDGGYIARARTLLTKLESM